MKSLIKDEKADSMAMLIIATGLLSFGLFYIVFTACFNVPIQTMNELITDGLVSADTKYFYELSLNMWRASPFFMVLGLILFCYERGKGTDLEVQTYFSYMFLMIITIITSTFLVYGFGLSVDGITSSLDVSILTDVSETWSSTTENRYLIIKMIYYFLMLPEVLGIVLYIFHPIIKQKEVALFRRENMDNEGEERGFSMGQF